MPRMNDKERRFAVTVGCLFIVAAMLCTSNILYAFHNCKKERIVSLMITNTDIWLDSGRIGLLRYDRQEHFWSVYRIPPGTCCDERTWREGDIICVERDPRDNERRYAVICPAEQKRTWVKYPEEWH